MKNKITNFITALQAENIKKRGTGFYWTSIIIGMLSPIMFFIVSIVISSDEIKPEVPYLYYLKFIHANALPFAYFFFPLLIIITASRITQLDHKNGGWQLMETQPTYKFSIYFSKFCTLLIANLISIVSFVIFALLAAWLLTFIIQVPKMATMDIPILSILHYMMQLFVASLLVTCLQFVISVLIPSFIWSIVVGFFGLLLTVFLEPFNLVPVWYPYAILSKIAEKPDGSDLGYWFTFTDYIGIAISIIVLYIGFRWYQNKTLKQAFFSKTLSIVKLLIVFVVCGGLTYWLMRPNQMPNYAKTVFCGKLESKETFHNLYLIDNIVNDTIAVIPIENNTFHYVFDKKVVTDNYTFIIDQKYKDNVFFGSNDSIYLDGKIYAPKTEFKFGGTRLAENEMVADTKEAWSTISYYLDTNHNLEKLDFIVNAIYKEWKEKIADSKTFKTVDNYIPKKDYAERNNNLTTIKYLNFWHEFVKKRVALYPKEKTNGGAKIKEIEQSVSLTDESLLSTNAYFDFVRNNLIAQNKEDIDDNVKAIEAIAKLKQGSFRDKMLFSQINKSMDESSNSVERNAVVAKYSGAFSDKSYQRKILNINKIAESLGKGKTAPNVALTSLDGKPAQLTTFQGKFVLIDTWATWCGPCKFQSPFFEKMAVKYKKENIVFMAISMDEFPKKWFIEAKSKSKLVMQFHVNDINQFSKDYNIVSIPRFILIDPKGNFVNSELPFPSDRPFETVLRKALHLEDDED